MSKMSELFLEIQERLEKGDHPTKICRALQIPLGMVYDVNESLKDSDEELSPFSTVNS